MTTTARSLRGIAIGVLIVAVIMIVTYVIVTRNNQPEDPRRFDNMDPKLTGCEKNAKTIGDPVPVMLPDGSKFGDLHFRASKPCGTVWGTVFTTGPRPEGYEKIVIAAERPRDSAHNSFESDAYDGNERSGRIWGDMLASSQKIGCVQVFARVYQNGQPGPVAKTRCQHIF